MVDQETICLSCVHKLIILILTLSMEKKFMDFSCHELNNMVTRDQPTGYINYTHLDYQAKHFTMTMVAHDGKLKISNMFRVCTGI